MESRNTASLSFQGVPDPVEGCLPEPRSDDLVLEDVVVVRSPHGSSEIEPMSESTDSAVDGHSFQECASNTMDSSSISYEELVIIFKDKLKTVKDYSTEVKSLFGKAIKDEISDEEKKMLQNAIFLVKIPFNRKWKDAQRKSDRFALKNNEWLANRFQVPDILRSQTLKHPEASTVIGRPTKHYGSSAQNSKRKQYSDLSNILEVDPVPKIMKSVELVLKRQGENDLSFILKEAMKSPN